MFFFLHVASYYSLLWLTKTKTNSIKQFLLLKLLWNWTIYENYMKIYGNAEQNYKNFIMKTENEKRQLIITEI